MRSFSMFTDILNFSVNSTGKLLQEATLFLRSISKCEESLHSQRASYSDVAFAQCEPTFTLNFFLIRNIEILSAWN